MGRAVGSLCRFTCVQCGCIELVRGGGSSFRCSACRGPLTPQYLAHQAVARAIRSGQIPRPQAFPCADCGGRASQYDHRDYSKPLDVAAVCQGCNVRRGPALTQPVHSSVKSADPVSTL